MIRELPIKLPEKLISRTIAILEKHKGQTKVKVMQKWKMKQYVVLRIDNHGFEPEDTVFAIEIDKGILLVFNQDALKEDRW